MRMDRCSPVVALVCASGMAFAQPPAVKEPEPPVKPAEPAKPDAPQPDAAKEPEKPKFKPELFQSLGARNLGPAIMSGRVSDIAVNPANHSEWYVGVASGGLWKTTNAGVTFAPIFDSYGSYSVGCVTIDPHDEHVIWVGTGENNSQRSVAWGDGVYVSRDAGKSFTNVGLKDSNHIGMIKVHPDDPNTVYVAAMGPLWSDGGDRGLYRTTDGGKTWEKVLNVSDSTGVSEIFIDPRNAATMYAVAYQRRRHVWTLINGGPESSIYKTTDGGETWRKIEKGLPGGDKGRIGMCISADPDVLYAVVEAPEGGGIYRSVDRGETWDKRSSYTATSPQYYHELFPDPKNADRFYTADTFMHVTDDGGATMKRLPIPDVHVDSHALWINPNNTNHLVQGNDGGVYESFDRQHWRHFENLPVMQFYRVGIDNSWPFYYVYGGTQDNSTIGGPSRTTDRAGVTNEDWFHCVGGDGFEVVVHPEDPNLVFCEWQDGGLTRFDRKSGEGTDIKPREKPGDKPYVFNWDTPLIVSPHSKDRLYYGGNFLFRSDDKGDSWTRVSEDLTRGLDRNQLKVMGVIQKPEAPSKHASTSIFGAAVSLAESPLVEGLLYVGTDDGLVQVSEDGGQSWRKEEKFEGVPEMSYVSDLEASRHGKDTVIAAFENHKMGDYKPYVLRSDDRGRTWKSITGNLPERGSVYTVAQDHVNPELLFCGTEFGAYFTLDGGKVWTKLGGLPTIEIRDIEIQRRDDDVVMASFGRGFYILHDYAPMRQSDPALYEKAAHLFEVKPALAYESRTRLGNGSGRGWSGSSYYNVPNPAYGAVFTVHIKEGLKTLAETRKEGQKKEGWTYPTVEQSRAEDKEPPMRHVLTIRDAKGAIVRRLDAPKGAGLHRVTWDLRLASTDPVSLGGGRNLDPWDTERGGVAATPGTYTVQLSKLAGATLTDLTEPMSFEVRDLGAATLAAKGAARTEKFEFERKVAELDRVVSGAGQFVGEQEKRLNHLAAAIKATGGLGAAEIQEHESLRQKLLEIKQAMYGDSTLARRVEPTSPSITERVGAASGSRDVTHPPTGTQRQQYDYALAEYEQVKGKITALESGIVGLETKVEKAGGPATPGRLPELRK